MKFLSLKDDMSKEINVIIDSILKAKNYDETKVILI